MTFRKLIMMVALAAAAGCDGSSANRLYGSMKEAYGGLPFEVVQVLRQEYNGQPVAMHVVYLDDKGGIQVKVTAKTPVVEGVEKDLVKDGALVRAVASGTTQGSQFPPMKSGKLTFDALGDVGQTASGRFFITFQSNPAAGLQVEGTLNGDFSATLQKQ